MAEKASKGFWDLDRDVFWQRFKAPISIFLIGLIMVGIGSLSLLLFQQKEAEVRIYPVNQKEKSQPIFVDLQGAVMKPGVYELPPNSRVNDLLVKAGGLSARADREWVSLNVNLAQILSDGIKLYIPEQGEKIGEIAGASMDAGGRININTANASQLDSLSGIGEKRAADIISGRPYGAIQDLLEKKIIPAGVFEQIKEQISVF